MERRGYGLRKGKCAEYSTCARHRVSLWGEAFSLRVTSLSECISVAADKSTSLLKCFSRPPGEPVWKNQSMPMELCWSSRVYWCIENAGNSVWQYITLTKSPPIWDWLCINLWKWCGFSVVLSELYWQYIFLVYFSSPSDDLITQQLHTCSSGISAEAQDEDWGSAGASLSSCSAQSGWRRAE